MDSSPCLGLCVCTVFNCSSLHPVDIMMTFAVYQGSVIASQSAWGKSNQVSLSHGFTVIKTMSVCCRITQKFPSDLDHAWTHSHIALKLARSARCLSAVCMYASFISEWEVSWHPIHPKACRYKLTLPKWSFWQGNNWEGSKKPWEAWKGIYFHCLLHYKR